jgi:DNA-binding transcriptional regulator YhcF (GntR family)
MNFNLDRHSPLSLKEQIREGIKGLIESGVLKPGQNLPSARDLAKTLSVNRNTTWSAYQELARQGFVESAQGSGTRVAKSLRTGKRHACLEKVFASTLEQALALGYDHKQTGRAFLGFLARHALDLESSLVMIVECNQETLNEIANTIQREIGCGIKSVLIQELEENPENTGDFLQNVDLVVTGFNHLGEMKRLLPGESPEVLGLLLKPDLAVLNELLNQPQGKRIGLTCANQRSTETFFKSVNLTQDSSLTRIWAGFDNTEKFKQMLKQCQVIYATHYVYDRVKKLSGQNQTVRKVKLDLDPSGIRLIRSRLAGKQRIFS